MNIISIIDKKRLEGSLTYSELEYAFNKYLNNEIKDYQMSALLMAITINGLNDEEVLSLVDIFVKSGKRLDFSNANFTADKHSTGGVGDKVTLILGPILASLGIKFPKMSGRGLGLTGGTIDKLESIKGFNVNLTEDEIIKEINEIGISLTSQTQDLVILDKYIYDLRSSTGTVSSLPLIAVSIMSKKIAIGANIIFIDIKCGSGALIKNLDEATELKRLIDLISKHYKINVETEITDMNTPLGNNIGNMLEVIEAIDVLKGKQGLLLNMCVDFATEIIKYKYSDLDNNERKKLVLETINNHSAYNKFIECIKYQGGDISSIKMPENGMNVKSNISGTIKSINALNISRLAFNLGAGRINIDDKIDYNAGIVLHKNIGDEINHNDILMTIYGKTNIDFNLEELFEVNHE